MPFYKSKSTMAINHNLRNKHLLRYLSNACILQYTDINIKAKNVKTLYATLYIKRIYKLNNSYIIHRIYTMLIILTKNMGITRIYRREFTQIAIIYKIKSAE